MHILLRQHGDIKRIKRHRITFSQNKAMLGTKALHGIGREVPQMTGHVVSRPIGSVVTGIVGQAIGHCHYQHTALIQQPVPKSRPDVAGAP